MLGTLNVFSLADNMGRRRDRDRTTDGTVYGANAAGANAAGAHTRGRLSYVAVVVLQSNVYFC